MSDDDNVGVIIFEERDERGMPGSIKNPTCHIWIQQTTPRKRSRGMATLRRRRRRNKEAVIRRRRSRMSGWGMHDEATGQGRGRTQRRQRRRGGGMVGRGR